MNFIQVKGIWYYVGDLFQLCIVHDDEPTDDNPVTDFCVVGVYFDNAKHNGEYRRGGCLYHCQTYEEAQEFVTELVGKLNEENSQCS